MDDRKAEPYSAEELADLRALMVELGSPVAGTTIARLLATLAQRDQRIGELEAHVPCPACTARTVGMEALPPMESFRVNPQTGILSPQGQQQASQLGGNILLSALAKLNNLGVTQTLGQSEQQDAMLLQWPANRPKV